MPSSLRVLLVTAVLPLVLAGCSGSSRPTAQQSPTASASAPTPAPTGPLAFALSYQVQAKAGVSDADLKGALTQFAALPGVTGASLVGGHALRVDLGAQTPAQRTAVLTKLRTLGTVSVPK
jgi:hypothetical protein